MTKAVFKKEKGLWTSLEVSGHSGYCTEGYDIVCAGISTAVIYTINLLEKLIGNHFDFFQDDEKGYVLIHQFNYQQISLENQSFINIIFSNLYDILTEIEKNYPKYLKIKIENNK